MGGGCKRGARRGDRSRGETEAGIEFTSGNRAPRDPRPTTTFEQFRRYSGRQTGVRERRMLASNSESYLGRPEISARQQHLNIVYDRAIPLAAKSICSQYVFHTRRVCTFCTFLLHSSMTTVALGDAGLRTNSFDSIGRY